MKWITALPITNSTANMTAEVDVFPVFEIFCGVYPCGRMNSNLSNESCQSSFTMPELVEDFLEMKWTEKSESECYECESRSLPLADSGVINVSEILSARRLTHGDDVKEVYLIELPSYGRLYEPGDTIGIIPSNTDEELMPLFKQLKICHIINKNCKIIQRNVERKFKSDFLDKITTLYEVFRNYVDIRCLPKKSLIRLMAEYTYDIKEKTVLEELCSKEGMKKYEEEILNCNRTFVDFFSNFPTCCPPVLRLLENLPPLLPRPYSIASSPISSPDRLIIVFTLARTHVNGSVRNGLCTGMLKSLVTDNAEPENILFKMYYRKKSEFSLPENNVSPLIFIGPGSGVAPFIGFLEHIKMEKRKQIVWLFYGCRYKSRDFLFEEELKEYQECGALTRLIVSFSRETETETDARYVQDNLKKYGKEVCDMIWNENAIVYVCGDAKGLRKDVMSAFVDILQKHKGLYPKEATAFIKTLQKQKKYLQDVWL